MLYGAIFVMRFTFIPLSRTRKLFREHFSIAILSNMSSVIRFIKKKDTAREGNHRCAAPVSLNHNTGGL